MRVKIDVEVATLSPAAQAATRAFVLSELHRVVYGYTLWIESVEVRVQRLDAESVRSWRVEARVTLTDGIHFAVSAQSPHPHHAIDNVVHGVWQRLHDACPPASRPLPPMPPMPQVA